MSRYRKKPVEIEAFLWTADEYQTEDPIWICEALRDDRAHIGPGPVMLITTLEGVMTAKPGDWIIRGVEGEIYPCRASIFKATYEPMESTAMDGGA